MKTLNKHAIGALIDEANAVNEVSEIYFNHASTSHPKSPECVDAIMEYMSMIPGARNSDTSVFEQAKKDIAQFFGAPGHENMLFTHNVSYMINMVLLGALKPGMHVVIAECEHASVLRPLHHLVDTGVKLTVVPMLAQGTYPYQDIERLMTDDKVDMCVMTHASNVTGSLFDAARIGAIAKQNDVMFALDASQSAGVYPLDVEKLQCDVLFFTGHKSMMGPLGVGGAYVRRPHLISPVLFGGTGVNSHSLYQPMNISERFEVGTPNEMGVYALSKAIGTMNETYFSQKRQHNAALLNAFYQLMSQVDDIITYQTHHHQNDMGIALFNVKGYSSVDIAQRLKAENIHVRGGLHCAPLMHKAIGTYPNGAVRVSLGKHNTEQELVRLRDALVSIIGHETQSVHDNAQHNAEYSVSA